MDPLKLIAGLQAAQGTGLFHSALIVRHGSVVLEAYSYPYDDTIYHDLASVTKSVTTTLVGIAATQGKLDLDAPIVSFFPNRTIDGRELKDAITVRDLASMSSGLDCIGYPSEITLEEMQASSDWAQFVLDLDVVAEPGTVFSYCSPGMHLLSAILSRATGMSAFEFARASLFEPLGIDDAYWPADPQGVSHGWGGLALHPKDAAKLGFLLLQGGAWEGRQIVSPGWVHEATSVQIETVADPREDYGYGWWVFPGQEEEVGFFRADGDGGQRILVVPSLDLVVVTAGGGFSPDAIFDAIRAAGTDDFNPLPPNPEGDEALRVLAEELSHAPEPEVIPTLPAGARAISGRRYAFESNEFELRTLRLDFDDPAEATLRLNVASELVPRVDRIGLDGVFRSSIEGRPIVTRGHWQGRRTFVIECDEGPGIASYEMRLTFKGRLLRLEVKGVTVRAEAEVPTS
jgi:CubicO group peptidase (beta-lactamase class C family)